MPAGALRRRVVLPRVPRWQRPMSTTLAARAVLGRVGSMTVTVENLAAVGNVVDKDYHHVTKTITPGAPLLLTDTYLKWYGLCREDQSISAAVDAEARA